MIESRWYSVCDQAGQPYTLEVGTQTLLLDGAPATVVALEDEHVTVGSSREVVAISYEALGRALLGEHPTLTDAGQLLAHSLVRWSALHRLSASLTSVQAALEQILMEARPWLDAPLPPYRFDALTLRALSAFDGSEPTTAMLARILGQSPQTIVTWAYQLGKTVSDAPVPLSNEQMPTPELAASCCMQIADVSVAVSSGDKKFRWNAEMLQQLETDFLASDAERVAASIREIADRHGWPVGSIQSKLYELGLPRRKRAVAAQREAESPAPEGHPFHERQEDDQG